MNNDTNKKPHYGRENPYVFLMASEGCMSINLCFLVKGGGFVDFPFQTPTKLTYEVFQAATTDVRLEIIKSQLKEWGRNEEDINNLLGEIKGYLDNPCLELSIV